MWGLSYVALAVLLLWQARRHGPRRALGVAALLALLVPTWALMGYHVRDGGIPLWGHPVDMRSAIGFTGLVVCCFRPRLFWPTRLVLADVALLCLMAVHVLSDWKNDGLSLQAPLRAFGEWGIAYLVGRTAIRSLDDLRALLPWALAVSMIFAALSLFEACSGVNVMELLFDPRPIEFMPRDLARWGFKRAYAVAKHPIFFGVLQVLLIPWAVYAASRAMNRGDSTWRLGAPLAAVVGVVCTLSRGPILSLLIAAYATVAVLKRRWRPWMIGVAAIGCVAGAIQFKAIAEAMHIWSGDHRLSAITVDDQRVEYTGTMSRIYLLDVYGGAMRRAGALGFGTRRVTGFPVNVPVGPEHAKTLARIRFIDNVYVLYILRFGYLGMLCFVVFQLVNIGGYIRLASEGNQGTAYFASMAGVLIATMFVLLTVWMPHDFGFVLLLNAGAAAGIRAAAPLG